MSYTVETRAIAGEMNALKCVSLAAQQLSRSFSLQNQQDFKTIIVIPDTRSQNKTTCHEETAILNTITTDNQKVITSQPDQKRKAQKQLKP